MADLISDVVKFIDKREVDLDQCLNKLSETDIVDDFIQNFDKLNFKYSQFI